MSGSDLTSSELYEEAKNDASYPLFGLLFEYGRSYGPLLIVGAVTIVVQLFLSNLAPFVLGVGLDGIFNEGIPYRLPLVADMWIPPSSVGKVWFTFFILAGVIIVEKIVEYGQNWIWHRLTLGLQHRIRTGTYAHMQNLGIPFFDDRQTGELMSIVSEDVRELEDFINSGLKSTVRICSFLVVVCGFMFYINWQFAFIPLLMVPLLGLVNYWFAGRLREVVPEYREQVGLYNAHVENNVSGIHVIKTYANERRERQNVAESSKAYREQYWNVLKYRILQLPTANLLTGAGLTVTFAAGGYWILEGPPLFFDRQLTAGMLLTYLLYVQFMTGQLWQVSNLVGSYETARGSAARISALQRANLKDKSDGESKGLPDIAGSVTFDEVSFTYPGEKQPALRRLSFSVAPKQTVGIVGRTGAGKTTLIKLLLRLYCPSEGTVSIDGIDLDDVSLDNLRESVGYVSQEPFLFDATIRENIAYGCSDVDEEAIRKAARKAGADEFVVDLSDGYETMVGEGGNNLSGGQCQRLVIARALLNDPEVLVLDEPVSQVDAEMEMQILKNVQPVLEDRTVFVVSHRLSAVRSADEILFLDDGEIVERGTHEELVDREGQYAKLWYMQTGSGNRGSELD